MQKNRGRDGASGILELVSRKGEVQRQSAGKFIEHLHPKSRRGRPAALSRPQLRVVRVVGAPSSPSCGASACRLRLLRLGNESLLYCCFECCFLLAFALSFLLPLSLSLSLLIILTIAHFVWVSPNSFYQLVFFCIRRCLKQVAQAPRQGDWVQRRHLRGKAASRCDCRIQGEGLIPCASFERGTSSYLTSRFGFKIFSAQVKA